MRGRGGQASEKTLGVSLGCVLTGVGTRGQTSPIGVKHSNPEEREEEMKTCEICQENASWITYDERLYCWDCVMGFGISAMNVEDNRTPSAKEINDWFESQKVNND